MDVPRAAPILPSTDQAAPVQTLAVLDNFKTDLLDEIGKLMQSLESRLDTKIDLVRNDVQRRSSSGRITSGTGSRGTTGALTDADGKIRFIIPDATEVSDLFLVAVKDDAWLPAMRITMMYTIMSFAELCPGAKTWVTDNMRKYYAPAFGLLDGGVSGFSMIFFSVVGDDIKSRYSSKLGALWSTLYTNIMVTMMMSVRRTVFKNRPIPAWLQSFGDIHGAYEYAKSFNEAMEMCNVLPLQRENSRASKRARRTLEAESAPTVSTGSSHPLRPEREVALRTIRSAVLRVLSDGRMKARLHIYKSVLFVAEEVAKYPSREAANAAGFQFILGKHMTEAEKNVPEDLSGIWSSIPKANVSGSAQGDEQNKDALENLVADFPSLKVRLVYMREIVGFPLSAERSTRETATRGNSHLSGAVGPRGVETALGIGLESALRAGTESISHASGTRRVGPKQYFMDEEEFSLHTVALGLFVDTYMVKEWPSVLRASPHSIRAVHIFAIALRGLISKVLNKEPSSMENKALGEVVFRVLAKEDTCATVFVGNRYDSDKERKTLDMERNKKFKISYQEYLEKQRQIDAAKNRDAVSSANQSMDDRNDVLDEGNQDFDVSWMEEGEGDYSEAA